MNREYLEVEAYSIFLKSFKCLKTLIDIVMFCARNYLQEQAAKMEAGPDSALKSKPKKVWFCSVLLLISRSELFTGLFLFLFFFTSQNILFLISFTLWCIFELGPASEARPQCPSCSNCRGSSPSNAQQEGKIKLYKRRNNLGLSIPSSMLSYIYYFNSRSFFSFMKACL